MKQDEVDTLKDIRSILQVVFDNYAVELKERHDVLLDEYDLCDLDCIIGKYGEIENEQ